MNIPLQQIASAQADAADGRAGRDSFAVLSMLQHLEIPAAVVEQNGHLVDANPHFDERFTLSNTLTLRASDEDGHVLALPLPLCPHSLLKQSRCLEKTLLFRDQHYEVSLLGLDAAHVLVALKSLRGRQRERQLLKEQIEELEQVKEDLEQLAFAACHDLRSPLRAMATLPTWISQDVQEIFGYLPPSVGEHSHWLQRQAKRLNRMLDDLLCYAKVGSSRSESHPARIELEELLRETWQRQPGHEAYALQLELEIDALTLPPDEVSLVFSHLLKNALAHHHQDSGRVLVRATEENDHYRLEVSDDGPGIDPQFVHEALKLFGTLKSRDAVEGSGLGLPIVSKIARSLRGELALGPGLDGRGTGVTLRLPIPEARE